MVPRVIEVRHVAGHVLWLRFSDGLQGNVDLSDDLWGEVFEPLQDEERFADVRLDVELGTINWSNGADFAPEFLHQRLKAA